LDDDLLERAADRRRDFGVDLVRGELVEGLVLLDRLPLVLQPLRDGAFVDRLAHLGHLDFGRHEAVPP
jgi:hypothetical protein